MQIFNSQSVSAFSLIQNTENKVSQEALQDVAEQFEALFVEEFLKAARQTEFSEGLFENEESKNYRQMLDKEYAQNIAKHADLGIARSIQEQFGKHLKDQ
jgi:flagellar protein FlgJ